MEEHMYHFQLIKSAIEKIIIMNKSNKIVLYPYGFWGLETQRILNDRYGIKEAFIIDNELSEKNTVIKKLSYLEKINSDEYVFLITSDNQNIYDEIRENLKRYVNEDNIMDIYPKVNMKRDRRIESLKLMAEWMNDASIEGNVAEVGVYKGNFAKHINLYFQDKKLYLFDTFEGFKNETLSKYVDNRMAALLEEGKNRTNYCINDNINVMLSGFIRPDNCIVKIGFFPDSANDVLDQFCYVSLDTDLYQGTMAGLEFFWPRMVHRGVIMIHDYNYYDCPGVKKAVDEFCIKNEIGIVCLADEAGSAVLTKS
jgi:O-methyltransferase